MADEIAIASAHGTVLLRPERADDVAFRFELFCQSRPPEWESVQIDPEFRDRLMRHQFNAQTASYRAQFPRARFDIIELDGEAIGRIVVDRPGNLLNIVDQAIVPRLRNKGLGTTIMRSLMDEARQQAIPVRLMVSSSNDPSIRLYLRLGFVPIRSVPLYIELEWKAPA
jgi:ribosomal protein S18 acetylase RimI-like enzyme